MRDVPHLKTKPLYNNLYTSILRQAVSPSSSRRTHGCAHREAVLGRRRGPDGTRAVATGVTGGKKDQHVLVFPREDVHAPRVGGVPTELKR